MNQVAEYTERVLNETIADDAEALAIYLQKWKDEDEVAHGHELNSFVDAFRKSARPLIRSGAPKVLRALKWRGGRC